MKIICFILIVIIIYLSLVKYKEAFSSKTNSMVCCVYNEDITWIHNETQQYGKIYLCKK